MVFVSGQVDWDGNSRVRHATLDGQAEGAIKHLVTVLNEAGSSLEDVLQLKVHVRGELADGMSQLVPVLARHFAVRPALTGIGVLPWHRPTRSLRSKRWPRCPNAGDGSRRADVSTSSPKRPLGALRRTAAPGRQPPGSSQLPDVASPPWKVFSGYDSGKRDFFSTCLRRNVLLEYATRPTRTFRLPLTKGDSRAGTRAGRSLLETNVPTVLSSYATIVDALAPVLRGHPGVIIVTIDGREGVGKTTLGRYLAWTFNVTLIETDLFRSRLGII